MTEEKMIEKINFTVNELDDEYYNCIFVSCNFSNLSFEKTMFDNCEFRTCDFTLTKFKETISSSKFIECKMVGADFTKLNKFSNQITFIKSQLDYATFINIKLQNTYFKECKLLETSFDDSDLSKSVFERCDLERTSFVGTNLEKVDFSTAFNYSINPNLCKLKKAIFSSNGLRGLVDYLNIEIKETL